MIKLIETNIIEINGVKYQQREQQKEQLKIPMSKTLVALMTMFKMTNGYGMYGNSRPKERPRVDIVKEYSLIKLKQSKLSRNDRDWVVRIFTNTYQEIKQETK